LEPNQDDTPVDPDLFNGEVIMEITGWSWQFHIGFANDFKPAPHRFREYLDYSRGFRIEGRIVEPEELHDLSIAANMMPFGEEMTFGPDGLANVGQIGIARTWNGEPRFHVWLFFPEDMITVTAVALGSGIRRIRMWGFGATDRTAGVRAFGFDYRPPS
jgi:hypothetical protein